MRVRIVLLLVAPPKALEELIVVSVEKVLP